jgi:hypothetical protein
MRGKILNFSVFMLFSKLVNQSLRKTRQLDHMKWDVEKIGRCLLFFFSSVLYLNNKIKSCEIIDLQGLLDQSETSFGIK